jgi:hypothetical protein
MMRLLLSKLGNQPWVWITGITLISVVCVAASVPVIPKDKLMPDFICYWTAGTLVASGQSPYDAALQTQIQEAMGWDRATDGLGKYDFLPYYYPPWFAVALTLLLPLGYEGARVAWYFLNVELLFLSGYLLSLTVTRVPRRIPVVAVPLFILSVISVLVGQTAIPILFLASLAWMLLERRCDWAAGATLALLTTKPQLAAVLVLALLLWASRQRRWRVVQGFGLMLGALSVASVAIVPLWPLEMVRASMAVPPPTAYFPWIGTTWLLALRTAGLQSWGLWIGYLALAVPFLALVAKAAVTRSRPLGDIMALGILAAFIVAPYGRHYDFPLLLIPLFVLMGGRLPELAGTILMISLLVLPYFHFGALIKFKDKYPSNVRLFPEWTFLWIPVLVTVAWLVYEVRAGRGRRAAVTGFEAEGGELPGAPSWPSDESPMLPEGCPT